METNQDQDHLKLLSIFHFIVGGICVFFACFPLIHFGVGIVMMSGSFDGDNGNQAPVWAGLLFAAIGGAFFLSGQALAWLTIYSGFKIKKREKYMLSFVVACVMCIFVPFGTALGIFTIIVLSRESVKQLYEKTF
jgi:heme/copper-type cytochrome/quinol oxidase subunit 3